MKREVIHDLGGEQPISITTEDYMILRGIYEKACVKKKETLRFKDRILDRTYTMFLLEFLRRKLNVDDQKR